MKKKLLVLVIFTLLIGMIVILTGCGNKETGESAEQNGKTAKELIESTANKLNEGDLSILNQVIDIDGNISLMAKDFPDANLTALDLSDAKDYKFEELYSFVKDVHKNGKQNIDKYSDLMNRLGIKETEIERIQRSFNKYEENFNKTLEDIGDVKIELNSVSEETKVYDNVSTYQVDLNSKILEKEENGIDTIYIMKEDSKYYILGLNRLTEIQKEVKSLIKTGQRSKNATVKDSINISLSDIYTGFIIEQGLSGSNYREYLTLEKLEEYLKDEKINLKICTEEGSSNRPTDMTKSIMDLENIYVTKEDEETIFEVTFNGKEDNEFAVENVEMLDF